MHRPSKISCFLSLLLAVAGLGPAGAQTARLVADIRPGPPAPGEMPAPKTFMPISGGSAFFLPGATPEAASILWATDGTEAGTRSLGSFQSPRFFGSLPGLAFFLAGSPDETDSSFRLWRTDGTRDGTFPVTTALASLPEGSAVMDGRLLATLCLVSTQNCSLYFLDGSATGVFLLGAIPAFELTAANGNVYFFSGSGSIPSLSLWRTDGTPGGTRAIRRLRPGWTRLLSASGSRLFYMNGDEGGELWTSDGSARGTMLVRTFIESGHDFIPRVTNFLKATGNGTVTFVAARGQWFIADLWRSDGTPRGTVRLTSFRETSGVKNLREDQIAVLGKRTLFVADDGVSGSRLWSTLGSLATTAPLVGCPGDCPELLAGTTLIPVGNRVLFAARDGGGFGLWTSDGTAAGTHLLAGLCPGGCDAGPTHFTALVGRIWFRVTFGGSDHLVKTDGTAAGTVVLASIPAADHLDLASDGAGGHRVFFAGMDTLDGAQPWVTDGTPSGTRRVSVLPAPAASSEPANLTALGDRLLFTAWDGTQSALWVADASGSGASIVPGTAVAGKAGPANVTLAGGRAFFTLSRGGDGSAQLWRTDGTAAGTAVVTDFPDRSLSDLHDFGGRLLFLATPTGDAERHTPSVWASDGTAAGTFQIFSLPDDILAVVGLTTLGAEIYMEVDRESEENIYRSDGTAAGTRSIRKFGCCSGYPTPRFVRQGDTVYFTALDSFYRTDGTAAGTSKVLAEDADGNPPVYSPSLPFVLGGRLFVFAGTPDQGDRLVLFRVDGGQPVLVAPAGSASLGDLYDPQLTALGDALFFRAWDPDHGMELWRTDGTSQGTVLVSDLVPGPGSSDPQGLTAAGGRLYFSAWDEPHGRELWTSDGTAAGTRLVDDIAPGAFSAAPLLLTPVAGRLFFTADDGLVGREPWSLPISPSTP